MTFRTCYSFDVLNLQRPSQGTSHRCLYSTPPFQFNYNEGPTASYSGHDLVLAEAVILN